MLRENPPSVCRGLGGDEHQWKLGTMSGDVDEVPSGRGVGTSLELDRDMFLGPCEHHEGVDATVEAGRLRDINIDTRDRAQDPQGFGCEPASDIY